MALPAFVARRLGQDAYSKRIAKGLDNAYDRAETDAVDVSSLRAVVFSDHHRGRGDGADDFRRCEQAYCAALGWYLEHGYELWLLGDVEELWENRPKHVVERYGRVLALERDFGARLRRFFGNHDMAWRREKNVRRFLTEHLPGARVGEALRLTVTDGGRPLGTLFLVHGHQGTLDSGNLLVVPFSRFVVRFIWAALQRARGFANTSPATDAVLRGKHDIAMAAWADAHPERTVLLAGHTHRPVFPGQFPPDAAALAAEREAAYRAATGDELPGARAELELARVRVARAEAYEAPELERPCYFNTGCCSFGDGDVTGLELDGGKVRLVRWLEDGRSASPRELAAAELQAVLGAVTGELPAV